MVREILTNWTTPGGGGVTVMFFAEGVPVEGQRAALGAFWTDLSAQLTPGVTWTVAPEGRELDTVTGAVSAFWADGTPFTGTGTSGDASQTVADATQVLIRWRTDAVRRGRRLQGRTFVPGLQRLGLTSGNLSPGGVTFFTATAQALADAEVGLQVWGRPLDGAPGVAAEVTSAAAWSELAVLRGRRG